MRPSHHSPAIALLLTLSPLTAGASEGELCSIPLAAGVLAPWDILLTPAVGAALMSASTVVVAINAQLLKRVRL